MRVKRMQIGNSLCYGIPILFYNLTNIVRIHLGVTANSLFFWKQIQLRHALKNIQSGPAGRLI